MADTVTRSTTLQIEADDVLAYLDEQLALGRALVIGVRSRAGLPCFEVSIPINRSETFRPVWAEVPCNLRPQWGALVGRYNWSEPCQNT